MKNYRNPIWKKLWKIRKMVLYVLNMLDMKKAKLSLNDKT